MKNTLFLLIIALSSTVMTAQEKTTSMNNSTCHIWSTMHSSGVIKGKFLRKDHYFEKDEIYVENYELIRLLPPEARTVIALYASLVPHLFNTTSDQQLAQALGGFPSLSDAREVLLKKRKGEMIPPATPYTLNIRLSNDTIFAEHSQAFSQYINTDKFRIDEQGNISYVPEALLYIPYDKEQIIKEYYTTRHYLCKLNGEEVSFRNTCLDPGNIESVAVSNRTRTIHIEQKNKSPQYFSLSDIDLTRLNFTVKNIREVHFIQVNEGNGQRSDYDESTRIETSAIKSISSGKYEDYNHYWIVINLK